MEVADGFLIPDADVMLPAGTVEVLAMPTKDILAWLRRLEVSTEGCVERQDLAVKLMGQLQLMHTAAAMGEWCQVLRLRFSLLSIDTARLA